MEFLPVPMSRHCRSRNGNTAPCPSAAGFHVMRQVNPPRIISPPPAGPNHSLHDAKSLVDVAYTDANGVAQTDSLPDVEHLIGSAHNDILAGDRRDNDIDGGTGNDTLYGGPGGGDDEMNGYTGGRATIPSSGAG